MIFELDGVIFSGVYVLFFRVYVLVVRWSDVGLIRKLMIDKGIKKEFGCSFMEVNGVNYEFFVGDIFYF